MRGMEKELGGTRAMFGLEPGVFLRNTGDDRNPSMLPFFSSICICTCTQ
jgi:hypothetical protein